VAKILVIDLGTTYFKFALFDRDGQLCHATHCVPPIQRPEADRMELEAADFADVLVSGIAQLGQQAGGLGDVEVVTFATQTNSFLWLDAADAPLTPIILWPDRRAADLEAEITQRSDLPGLRATTGIPAVGAQFMIAKLLWLRRQFPQTWRQMSRLCLVSDYLSLLLTGRHVTEAGAAGLTALVDIGRCRWWPEMLARMELDERCLPDVVRAGTDLGPLRPPAADQYGLPRTCRFVVGCLDQYAGAIGAGNVGPGLVSETTGTVLATVCFADRLDADLGPTVFQGPAFAENAYYRMVFGDVSANYLEWYRSSLPDHPDFEGLTAMANGVTPGADGLRLNTSRPPTVPEEVFHGWTARHSRGHAVRAILEAVAVALRGQTVSLCGGTPPGEVRSAGGAARSDLWLQIKADVLGVPFRATQCPEPTSLGAAILAEAARSGEGVPEIARRWVRLGDPYRPNPETHRRYRTTYPNRARDRSQR
jgi:xylulokinase